MYQYRDGQGVGNHETKDHLSSLFVHFIPLYRDQHDEFFIYKDAGTDPGFQVRWAEV